jgi:uncharacterized membrane protein YhaH (DUF805 family)
MIEAYFIFSGRMRRSRLLVYSVLLIVLLVIIGAVGMLTVDLARSVKAATLFFEAALALLWLVGWAAMGVKRLHDLGKPGWHYLWLILAPQVLILAAGTSDFTLRGGSLSFAWSGGLLSLIGLVWWLVGLFYLLLAAGTESPNRYGHPP